MDSRERAVADASCGNLFFGTPHKGYVEDSIQHRRKRADRYQLAPILRFLVCFLPILATGKDRDPTC